MLVFVLRSQNSFNWTNILLPPLLWLDTLILIASSMTFSIGHGKLRANDQLGFFHWVRYTAVLGVLFLVGQFAVWEGILGSGQLMRNNPHSSFFFILSGMHGVHILVGLGWIGGSPLSHSTSRPAGRDGILHTRVLANAVAIFWHYLDGLWVVLFALLLLVKKVSAAGQAQCHCVRTKAKDGQGRLRLPARNWHYADVSNDYLRRRPIF